MEEFLPSPVKCTWGQQR